MDKAAFYQGVQEALEKVRDPIQLASAPIGRVLLPDGHSADEGWALSRFLLRSISELEPPDGEAGSWPDRRHRVLTLRYVNGLSPNEVAEEMSVSRRHFYRLLNKALDDFCSYLWSGIRSEGGVGGDDTDETSGTENSELLLREAALLNGGNHQDTLADVVTRTIALLDQLANRLRVGISIETPEILPEVEIHPEILRQFMMALLPKMMQLPEAQHLSLRMFQEGDRLVLAMALSLEKRDASYAERLLEDELLDRPVLHLVEAKGASIEWRTETECVHCFLKLPLVQMQRVLVVDDNEDVLSLFSRYLGTAGYHPILTRKGEEAIKLAHKGELYAIILDLMMSGEDGWDVLQDLISDPHTSDIPIVVCSVLEHGQLALMLGASRFLKKPVMRESLLQALEALGDEA